MSKCVLNLHDRNKSQKIEVLIIMNTIFKYEYKNFLITYMELYLNLLSRQFKASGNLLKVDKTAISNLAMSKPR